MTPGRRRSAAVGVALVVAVVACADRGLHTLGADRRRAQRIDAATAAVDRRIALGRTLAAHRRAQLAEAARLARAVPGQVDDQSLLAALVAASASSGAALVDETRGQPAAGPGAGILGVPVQVDVNGTDAGVLTAFSAAVEHQPRLLAATALDFSFTAGASLRLTASAYEAPGLAPPGGAGRAP